MNYWENRDIVIGGRRFRNLDDLEDFCAYFPEFEEDVIDSGVLTSYERKASMDTYWIVSELEYGDGNMELPYRLHHWRHGEVLFDKSC